jgi:uncharacterized YigZ family protein
MENLNSKYHSIEKDSRAELVIERSRFIAHSISVGREDEARQKIKAIQQLYPDATHYCYAWRVGLDPISEFATDAGEPRGTAGRPILGAIRRRELTNVAVTIIRYFGGKKLGVRGLIDAYRQAAEQVLEISGIIEREIKARFMLQVNPIHFQAMVNQIISFCRGKQLVQIDPDQYEIVFQVALHRHQEALSLIELKQKEGAIVSFWESTGVSKGR